MKAEASLCAVWLILSRNIANSPGFRKKISCHSLRHTFATYKASKGVTALQLQGLLGHNSIHTSLLYVHMAITDGKKLMEQTSL